MVYNILNALAVTFDYLKTYGNISFVYASGCVLNLWPAAILAVYSASQYLYMLFVFFVPL